MTLNLDLLKVSKMTHNYDLFKVLIIHKVSKIRQKKNIKFFVLSMKMLNLSKRELRLIPKKRSITGCKSMSKNELINAINISEPTKNNKNNIFKSKRKEIKRVS